MKEFRIFEILYKEDMLPFGKKYYRTLKDAIEGANDADADQDIYIQESSVNFIADADIDLESCFEDLIESDPCDRFARKNGYYVELTAVAEYDIKGELY